MGTTSSNLGSKEHEPMEMKVDLEDLDMQPRRDVHAAAQMMQNSLGVPSIAGSSPQTSGGATSGLQAPISEEIFPGGEPAGQRSFREDGLIGTEKQQLELLAYYAELCSDYRRYQRNIRAPGTPQAANGAQLLLLSGEPGTGKTRHAVSFARALGLPLLAANPQARPGGACNATWAAQLQREVKGRDCVVFFDEIDRYAGDEAFASELRQLVDGVCQPVESKVLLVGTTNSIHRLPKDVIHRAEVIKFDRPQQEHLAEMWKRYAQHLDDGQLNALAATSTQSGATGRDVRHCASRVERQNAIGFLNSQGGMGFCHGGALMNCPGPSLEDYIRCIQSRSE